MSVQIGKDITTVVVEVPKSNVAVENAVTQINVQTSIPQITISAVGVQGKDGESPNVNALNDFTASYYIDSASIVNLIQQATNEQDLSNFALLSGSNNFIGNQIVTGSVEIANGNLLSINGVTMRGSGSVLYINGDIVPDINNLQSLGTTDIRWKDAWIGPGSIFIADSVIPNSDLVLEAINNIFTVSGSAGLEVGSFKFIDNELFLKNEGIPIIIGSGSSTAPVELKRPLQIISGETGNVTFNATREGRVHIISPTIPANDIGALSIIGNPSGSYQPVINPSGMLHITSNNNQAARVTVDGFGSNIGAIFVGRHARGTAANPTPTLSGDILARFSGLGYSTSSYFPIVGGVPTSLEFQATENYSTSGAGSRAAFYTYRNGHVTRSLAAVIDNDGLILPNIPTYENKETILVWDSVTGRVGKQSGVSAIDGGAAASVFIMTTEVLNGGNA